MMKAIAPVTAAITWPTVRVRRGPSAWKSPNATSRPAPVAPSATQNSTTSAAIQPGWPITAEGRMSGVVTRP